MDFGGREGYGKKGREKRMKERKGAGKEKEKASEREKGYIGKGKKEKEGIRKRKGLPDWPFVAKS